MHLTAQALADRATWKAAGIDLFDFDRNKAIEASHSAPVWVHFGCGNLFKAFHAAIAQELLEKGEMKAGIITAGNEVVDMVNRPHDNLALKVTLKSDGTIDKTVIGSIAESVIIDSSNEKEYARLKEIFTAPSLQLCTFTITEKGYNLYGNDGKLVDKAAADMAAGPEAPVSYMGLVAALLYERYLNGAVPVAMVSTDNCSHNGDKLKSAVSEFARAWEEKGLVQKGFCDYISNPAKVSFPWTMIDKITPGPDEGVRQMLMECGYEDVDYVKSSRNSIKATFVNAEETGYLVIEDSFPNGRPAMDKAGVIFTERETVDKVERMKVCTCLNPLHTAMSVYGCMLGYTKISEEMKDEDIVSFIKLIGYKEGLPVVTDPGIINPKEFIDTVVGVRLTNPFMPDAPQRIACDTSQKLGIRFGVTIEEYLKRNDLDVKSLKCIPLVHAGWLRYLMGVDDNGEPFEVSPDPLYEAVSGPFRAIKLGDQVNVHELCREVLCRKDIFRVDLYEAGLGEQIEEYFAKLIAGKGAVRKTLHETVAE